jgi:hypothetical protein
VFTALTVTRFIEDRTGWSIRACGRSALHLRTVHIRVGKHTVTAEDPPPANLCDTLAQIN